MNNKILIITVFVSNIAFGAVLDIDFPKNHVEYEKVNKLSDQIIENLYDKGLELNIAKQKLSQSFKGNVHKNDIIIQNILKEFPNITQKEIVANISNSILRGKIIDLSSYDTLVSIIQKTTLTVNQNIYTKVQKIYKNNS